MCNEVFMGSKIEDRLAACLTVRVARIIGVDSSIKNSALQKINFAFYTQITNNYFPTPIISRLQLFLPLG